MSFNLRPGTSLFGNITFTPGTNENYVAPPTHGDVLESLVELYLNATDSGVVDSSSNSHQLTAHSSISVVNDSPYNNGTSISFDGNGDYLTIPTSDSTVIGSGDFTFETWIKFDTIEHQNRYLRIAEAGPYTDSTGTWRLGTTGQNTQIGLTFSGTSINSNDHLSLNEWHHVAVSRSGTDVAMFINGVKQTQTMSSSANIDTALTHIGTQVLPETWFHGEMADIRLVKGTAVYTETFTPSTEELTAVAGTSLLISGNGGISDASPSSHTLSTYGNVTTTSDSPYSTGKSMGFNGNYLTTTDGVDFSDNDFTIELWWYPTSTGRQGLFHGSYGADWSIGIDYNSTYSNPTLGFWASSNGSTWDLVNSDPGGNGVTTGSPTQNAWNHIAYVRNGSTFTLYLNGVNVGEVTGITESIHNKTTTHGQSIGTWWKATGWGGGPMSGNVADYRITLDAVYTENFSVPTEPVGDYTVAVESPAPEPISASDFTITGLSDNTLYTSANGLSLLAAGGSWSTYRNLPAYLTGLLATGSVNDGNDHSWTIPTCKVYMIRQPDWQPVDLTGWTLIESGTDYINYPHDSRYTNLDVYSKDFTAGTYTFDNFSAMYMFADPE